MHELSIAQNLLEIAAEELEKHGCSRLKLLRLEVGAMSGVVVDSLRFGFESLIAGTPNEGAKLEVQRIPLRLRCLCGTEFEAGTSLGEITPCPQCGEFFGHGVLAGKELRIVWMDGE